MQRIRKKLGKKNFSSKLRFLNFKTYVPRSLYGRFLLIVTISALVVQIVSIYVFFYTHLDVISKQMSRSVVSEMVFMKDSINKSEYQDVLQDLSSNTGITFAIEPKTTLRKNKIGDSDWKKHSSYQYFKPLIDPYNRFKSELDFHKLKPYKIYENGDDFITVKIQRRKDIVSFEVPIKKITSSSSYVFAFWMILTIVITSVISIIFFRNQIRSIAALSDAAEKFGRGQNVSSLKPSGAQEIRSLTISFMKMKDRVKRQITQRTEMLSAVSHDLRTPLTRMKLQVEMMSKSPESADLKSDISDMEKLVNEYLEFARSDGKEKASKVKMKKFLKVNLVDYYLKMNLKITSKIDLESSLEVTIKKLALKRALMNLLDNSFKFGKEVILEASLSSQNLIISIDDDGPGIPIEERRKVFQPFYRLDASRNLDKKSQSSGSGLGLSIVMDAVTSHGGRIRLADSKLGGLRVTIFIPI